MGTENDDLDALSAAAGRQRVPAAPRGNRRPWLTPLVLILLTGLGAAAFFLLSQPDREPAPQVEAEPVQEASEVATPAETQNYRRLRDRWQALSTRSPIPGDTAVMGQAREAWLTIDQAFRDGRFEAAAAAFGRFEDASKAVERLDQTRADALLARKAAAEAREQTDEGADLTVGDQIVRDAERLLAAGDYPQAQARFAAADEAFVQAAANLEQAKQAKAALRSARRTIIGNFDEEALDTLAGAPWAKARQLLREAQAAIDTQRFEDAKAATTEALGLAKEVSAAAMRAQGRHLYALQAGYHGADLLLRREWDETGTASSKQRFATVVQEAGLPMELPDAGVDLLQKLAQSIEARYDQAAASSCDIGAELRVVEQILESARDGVDPAWEPELRRSLQSIRSTTEQLGYPQTMKAHTDALVKAIGLKPPFEAVRAARAAMVELLRELQRYETGVLLVPQ